jgi:hypothetical protein
MSSIKEVDTLTSININLKERKITIEIARILSTRKEGPCDFPEMVIQDTNGKQHVLSNLDFPVNLQEWNQIKPGTKIEITIQEAIRTKRIIF